MWDEDDRFMVPLSECRKCDGHGWNPLGWVKCEMDAGSGDRMAVIPGQWNLGGRKATVAVRCPRRVGRPRMEVEV